MNKRTFVPGGFTALLTIALLLGAPAAGKVPWRRSDRTYAASIDSTRKGRPLTLRQAYPDYRPGANDPELDAVVQGRRHVKRHNIELGPGGSGSLKGLIELVVAGVTLKDGDILKRSAVTHDDFVRILWPEFPQSRPASGLTGDEVWPFVERKNLVSFNRATGTFSRSPIELVDFKVGAVRPYTNFRIHTDITVTVRSRLTGAMASFHLIRSIVERKGRFKVYSTWD